MNCDPSDPSCIWLPAIVRAYTFTIATTAVIAAFAGFIAGLKYAQMGTGGRQGGTPEKAIKAERDLKPDGRKDE